MPPRVFGHPPGVPIGAVFVDREALRDAGVHLPPQAGIAGGEREGAESIVVSGGYEDDEDYGDYIVYTGHGGQENGKQVADQEWKRGNLALRVSEAEGYPVRVARGAGGDSDFSPATGYRYDGLFVVEQSWRAPGRSGFLVCRFRLRELGAEQIPEGEPTTGETDEHEASKEPTTRIETTVQRLVRSTAVVRAVKKLHDYRCQMCGETLDVGSSLYAEGAHIRPLGRPHDGPDAEANVLCLCPNHHVLFDYGVIVITDDLDVVEAATGSSIGALRSTRGHRPAAAHLAYHRQRFGFEG
jgi:putative restriction endonuclease